MRLGILSGAISIPIYKLLPKIMQFAKPKVDTHRFLIEAKLHLSPPKPGSLMVYRSPYQASSSRDATLRLRSFPISL